MKLAWFSPDPLSRLSQESQAKKIVSDIIKRNKEISNWMGKEDPKEQKGRMKRLIQMWHFQMCYHICSKAKIWKETVTWRQGGHVC